MENWSEQRLIEACVQGNTEAFGILFKRARPLILSRIAGKVDCWHEREDIAQEVLAKAFQKLHTLSDSSKFRSWLSRIADNTTHSWNRRRVVQTEFIELLDESLTGEFTHPSHRADLPSGKTDLRAAFLDLSHAHRRVLQHRYFDENSYRQIAQRMCISENKVKGRLQKAKEALRKRMKMTERRSDTSRSNIIDLDYELIRILSAASRCCSGDPQRRVLQGVMLDPDGTIVASDGRHLLHRKTKGLGTLSTRTIIDFASHPIPLNNHSGRLTVGINEAVMGIHGLEDTYFPIIEGKYPNFKRVIPEGAAVRIAVDVGLLQEAMAEFESYLAPKHPPIESRNYRPQAKLGVDYGTQELRLVTSRFMGYDPIEKSEVTKKRLAKDQFTWQYSVAIKVEILAPATSDGSSASISFNYEYFKNAIDGLTTKDIDLLEIRIKKDHPYSCGILILLDSVQPDNLALVMPMKMD